MALDTQILDRLFNSPQLPSLPAIALQIIEMVQQEEVDVEKISEVISLDPALSSKMLKTVNSSFYGLPQTIGSVQQAVVVLGLNSVKTLALGFSLVSNLTEAGGEEFDHMSFWRRCLFSATAAKQICEMLHIVQAEEVFMASLLQDVGLLALSQVLGDEYSELMRQTEGDHSRLGEIEQAALGGTHAEVGAALAESWGLPPLLVDSIRMHEDPDASPENLRQLIRAVSAGGLAADLIANPDDESSVADYFSVLEMWFNIDGETSDTLLRRVFKHAGENQRLFELPTGELGTADKILERAKAALQRIENESGDGSDAAASVLDRKSFDKCLDQLFMTADAQQPLSLLFVDIDQFKEVNAAHGTDAGDAVLQAIAQTLRESGKGEAQTFRYQEDEYTLLCTDMDRSSAALLADRLRTSIEKAQYDVGTGEEVKAVKVTASIGVATYEGAVFKRSDQLMKAASKGVLAAKDGGRNVVRVFVPRTPSSGSDAA